MNRYAVARLGDVPRTDTGFHAVQHYFGLEAFGVNAFVAAGEGDVLIDAHDETGSGQQELYVVLAGAVRFELDGESVDAAAVSFVAVPDPAVRRSAEALTEGATLLAVGSACGGFATTWNRDHFEGLPSA